VVSDCFQKDCLWNSVRLLVSDCQLLLKAPLSDSFHFPLFGVSRFSNLWQKGHQQWGGHFDNSWSLHILCLEALNCLSIDLNRCKIIQRQFAKLLQVSGSVVFWNVSSSRKTSRSRFNLLSKVLVRSITKIKTE
jgi:hypothetical protein